MIKQMKSLNKRKRPAAFSGRSQISELFVVTFHIFAAVLA